MATSSLFPFGFEIIAGVNSPKMDSPAELQKAKDAGIEDSMQMAVSSSSLDSEKEILGDDCSGLDERIRLSDKSWLQKLLHYIKSIRMEPGFLIYMIASVMGNIMASDLLLDRACRINMKYNDTICDVLTAT